MDDVQVKALVSLCKREFVAIILQLQAQIRQLQERLGEHRETLLIPCYP